MGGPRETAGVSESRLSLQLHEASPYFPLQRKLNELVHHRLVRAIKSFAHNFGRSYILSFHVMAHEPERLHASDNL